MGGEAGGGLEILGRQSSHYTRVVRIFAHELDLPVRFTPIYELMSLESGDYGGNPALKLPILRADGEAVFGTLNICRVLVRRAGPGPVVCWPEDARSALLLNAYEILAHAMAAQVEVVFHEIVQQRPADAASIKRRQSLLACVEWLDRSLDGVLTALPDRTLSYFEVCLYCLLSHFPFRNPIHLGGMSALTAFERRFGERPSAKATPYRFDAPQAAS
ncbi:MAG TPA: glutathione S-transferase N-terminal domain-containing protein [Xanthomonadaceae bacterium]|nr:glutathione S-transferase N-terminal domain-containing protein [Xanthomonadaceae bacterium]